MIYIIEAKTENDTIDPTVQTRAANIFIQNDTIVYDMWVGRLPLEGDLQTILNLREAELWAAAQAGSTPISVTEREAKEAPGVARAYFTSHPAAVTFVRLTPAEQEAQIDAMTNAQMKTLLKYLTIAVAMLIKRELL